MNVVKSAALVFVCSLKSDILCRSFCSYSFVMVYSSCENFISHRYIYGSSRAIMRSICQFDDSFCGLSAMMSFRLFKSGVLSLLQALTVVRLIFPCACDDDRCKFMKNPLFKQAFC